jgi:homoserine dehydrogenase
MSDIQSFRQSVEAFIAARGWTPTRFGRAIAGDPLFVFDLREGREPRSDTRVRCTSTTPLAPPTGRMRPRPGLPGICNLL